MKKFLKILLITLFLLHNSQSNTMHYWKQFQSKFKNLPFKYIGLIGIGLGILALYKIKKQQIWSYIRYLNLKIALDDREKLRQKILKHNAEYNELFGVEHTIEDINKKIEFCTIEELPEKQQEYRNKMLERRNKYKEAILNNKNIDKESFNTNWESIESIVRYLQCFYFQPFSKEKLNVLEIEESPSKMLSKQKRKSYGLNAIEFVDEFLVALNINPWYIELKNIKHFAEEHQGSTKYKGDIKYTENKEIKSINIKSINITDIILKLNFNIFTPGHLFLNSSSISHEAGHLFEGHNFFQIVFYDTLKITNTLINFTLINLRRCFEAEADITLLIRNKFACFNALACYMALCILNKKPDKLNIIFNPPPSSNIHLSNIHPSIVEKFIHIIDVYFQVHKEQKQSYEEFQYITKGFLFLELKKYLPSDIDIEESIDYFFDENNYPKDFKLMVPRINIDKEYQFLDSIPQPVIQ